MAVALATALAVTVKAVWGTNLGISGTRRRPSMLHSEELFGPDMLKNISQLVLGSKQTCHWVCLRKRKDSCALTGRRWWWVAHHLQPGAPLRDDVLLRYWQRKVVVVYFWRNKHYTSIIKKWIHVQSKLIQSWIIPAPTDRGTAEKTCFLRLMEETMWKKLTPVFWWVPPIDPSCPSSGPLELVRHLLPRHKPPALGEHRSTLNPDRQQEP